MMLEGRFAIESQVGVIASNSAKLAKSNFGGVTLGHYDQPEGHFGEIRLLDRMYTRVDRRTLLSVVQTYTRVGGHTLLSFSADVCRGLPDIC